MAQNNKKEKTEIGYPLCDDRLLLTQEQLNSQYEIQKEFIELIHPNLKTPGGEEQGAVEFRPIKRGQTKTYFKSTVYWSLTEQKDQEYLRKHLEYLNGEEVCQFYSTWTLDYHMPIVKSKKVTYNEETKCDEEKITYYQKGTIHIENALYTQVLPLDLDGVTWEEYLKYKQIFVDLNIQSNDVWTGHGVQMLILLDRKMYNKEIFSYWLELLFAKGFKLHLDPKVKDCARVLRIPASFNYKGAALKAIPKSQTEKVYVPKFPEYYGTIKSVVWLEKTTQRYDYLEIFNKIRTLPDVIATTETINKNIDLEIQTEEQIRAKLRAQMAADKEKIKAKKEANISKDKESTNENQEDINQIEPILTEEEELTLEQTYPMVTMEELPPAIKKAMLGGYKGHRNDTAMFLAIYLQNYCYYSKEQIYEVINIFSFKCKPQTVFSKAEIDHFLTYRVGWSKEMCKQYGYIDFKKIKVINRDKMKVSKQFFFNYNNLSDEAAVLYLKMKLHQENEKQVSFTVEQIENILKIKKRTFFKYIKELLDLGLVEKCTAYKKDTGTYTYNLNLYKQNSYIVLNKSLVELLLLKCNAGEIKLYTYMKYTILNQKSLESNKEHKEVCRLSQSTLGDRALKNKYKTTQLEENGEIKVKRSSQSTVSKLIGGLEKKHFIEKQTIGYGVYESCIYVLNR